jgi:hypothetical protein
MITLQSLQTMHILVTEKSWKTIIQKKLPDNVRISVNTNAFSENCNGSIIIEETSSEYSVFNHLDNIIIMLQEIGVTISEWKIYVIEYNSDPAKRKKSEIVTTKIVKTLSFHLQPIINQ